MTTDWPESDYRSLVGAITYELRLVTTLSGYVRVLRQPDPRVVAHRESLYGLVCWLSQRITRVTEDALGEMKAVAENSRQKPA